MHYSLTTPTTSNKHLLIRVIVVVLLLCAIGAALELTNTTHFFHKKSAVLDTNSKTPTLGGASPNAAKGEPHTTTQPNTSSSATTNQAQPGDNKSNTGSGASTNIVAPSAEGLVSNHHPNLSGTPAPNTISSVCTTTPGASCTITFTQNGVTKSLPAEVTDRGGSAYWNWKLQDIGLSQGSWKIQAVATLGSQIKTTDDALALEVSP